MAKAKRSTIPEEEVDDIEAEELPEPISPELLEDDEDEEEDEDEDEGDMDELEDDDSLFDVLSALLTSEESGENIVEVLSGIRTEIQALNKNLLRLAKK